MMEGISSEAGRLAGHLKAGKSAAGIYDSNSITIEAATDLAFNDDVASGTLQSYGWKSGACCGRQRIRVALRERAIPRFQLDNTPSTMIIVHSHIG